MSTCTDCGAPLEWTPSREHARCSRCAALFTSDLTPVRLEAPGGGFEPDFQAIFEEQLGFSRRNVPPTPPSYWGVARSAPRAAQAPANNIARMMQIGIAGFVFFILAIVGLYVAWVLYAAIPH